MALTDKLTAIANAIRGKTGGTGALTLAEMVNAINNLKTTFKTQTKTATPTESEQTITTDNGFDGLSSVKVGAISKTYVGSSVTKQSAKTITPTKSKQTACASGVYTTGAISVDPIPSDYIIPSGSETKTQNGTYDVTSLAQLIVNVAGGGGGLPSGIQAIAYGEDVVTSAFTTTQRTITHNLGVTPNLVLYFAPSNVAQTYSMLFAMRGDVVNYRSGYNSYYVYHGNNTTNITVANSNNATYGVGSLTTTTFKVASHSTSYYWRAGIYKWVAIKFS